MNGKEYKVTVWKAKVAYCVCPLYMETPNHRIFNSKGAYIREIINVNAPKFKMKKKINRMLGIIVKNEF